MGFYDNGSTIGFDTTPSVRLEDLVEDASIPTFPESASYLQCALEGAADDEANWNGIMMACGLQEYTHFKETGENLVYTEAVGGGFIESVRAFLRKVWEKIKALFKKFMIFLDSATKSGKDFINKYRSDINMAVGNIPDNATINGYKFTLDEYKDKVLAEAEKFKSKVTNAYSSAGASISKDNYTSLEKIDLPGGAKINNEDSWSYEDEMEKIRGGLLSKSPMSANEFSKELFEMLRNGESSKESIDLNSSLVSNAVSSLDGYTEENKNVKASYTTLDKFFRDLDKSLSKVQTELSKQKPKADSNALIWIQRAISLTKGISSTLQTANGIYLTASKDKVNQAKAICVKVVSYKSKTEGYSFENYDGIGGFMEAAIARMR